MDKGFSLHTPRTIMRMLTVQDAEDFYRLNLNPEVLQYTGDHPFVDIQEAAGFLTQYDQYERYGVGRLAAIEKTTKAFIGWCGLRYCQTKKEYDIGFRFFQAYWNQGFATETAKKCLEDGFNRLQIDSILGRAMIKNIASIKVLEKLGMQFKEKFDFEGQEGVIYEWFRRR